MALKDPRDPQDQLDLKVIKAIVAHQIAEVVVVRKDQQDQ
jgi:hypothetical protein